MLASTFSSGALRAAVLASACLLASAGCSLIEDLDPLQGGGGASSSSTSSVGGSGGVTSSSTSSTGGAGGMGGSGGDGGGGGSVDPCGTPVDGKLVDCGLLSRYYLDEAASGTVPVAALDSAPNPVHVPLQYQGGLTYTEVRGQRGLHFPTAGIDGGAYRAIAGTKLFSLDGSTTGTIEAVLDFDEVTGYGSRAIHIGQDSAASFSLVGSFPWEEGDPLIGAATELEIRLRFPERVVTAYYDVALHELGRVVLHAVLDSNQPVAIDRVRLYLNGTRVTLKSYSSNLGPPTGSGLTLNALDSIGLGNRAIGERTPKGNLYYGAYYLEALTTEQLTHNALELLANDDRP